MRSSITMKKLLPFIFFYSIFYKSTIAIDTISPNQTLQDNGETLISAGKTFEMGFFSPWTSNNRYIGIWYKSIPQQTIIWVANKNNPLTDSSGILTITADGNILIMHNQSNIIVWSSNSSTKTGTNQPLLQLLDTGNLVVLKDGSSSDSSISSSNFIWQSFDHPCDTLIPGMKLGWNFRTGQEWYLTSWNSPEDPSDGDYTYKLDPRGLPQLVLRKGSSEIQYRSGPWDGLRFGGGPELMENAVFNPIFVFDTDNVYYSFEDNDINIVSRFVVNQSGLLEHLSWSERHGTWDDIITLQGDSCDEYAACGPYGICNVDISPVCQCPNGFVPKLPQDWEVLDWSGGCVEKVPLNCSKDEGFRKFSGLKLPDTSYFLVNRTVVNTEECEDACLRNCSCVAYAKTDFSGCVVWFGDLLDIREYSEGGQDLYIRMAASELESHQEDKRTVVIISMVVVASGVLLLGFICCHVIRKKTAVRRGAQRLNSLPQDYSQDIGEEDLELPLIDMVTVSTATNNFSFTNKIGEGGFGPVYKGTLSTGQEIAVKRLSKYSVQGLKELKNELILIAKLQHRNLVRLLGYCIHGEERMLIYEYMPNKSLDLFIFNQTRGTSLAWRKRFDIIVGIARGLLYLHRDSRLRIIHRDLKASNILLDQEMNPKISDFGLARIFRADQTVAETNRVIGTYGYMAPEYAIDGLFSMKSDVYSFGVLVLEIVSGKKNRGFYHPEHDLNLLGYAWKLWNEGRAMELMDAFIENPVPISEVLRCIQVGLLCVQQRPEDRPTMSSALLMLDSENSVLLQPKQPVVYTERFPGDTDLSTTGKKTYTVNEVTVTMLQGR